MKKEKHVLGSVQITRKCNQNCLFCSAPHSDIDLTIKDIEKRMLELKNSGSTEIMFTGGEPTLRDDIPRLISLAHKIGFKEVSIQTNGFRLHDESVLKSYISAGEFKFDISFHSFKKEIFEKITSGLGSFEKFIKGLNNVKKYNIPAYFTIVINSLNFRDLKNQVIFAEENFPSIKHFSFNFVDPSNNALENKWIIPRLSESKDFINDTFDYIIKKGMSFRIEFIPLCFLLPRFREYSSEFRRERFNEPSYTVSLNKEDINNSKPFERGNNYSKAPKCQSCQLNEECAGINPRYAGIYGVDEILPVNSNFDTGKEDSGKHAIIQVDNQCNHLCVFCSVSSKDKKEIDFNEVKQKIDFFIGRGVDQLTLSGGEPTLNKDLIRILEYAKEKNIKKINLQTNGILLSNPKFLKKIIDAFPVDFLVSFHASDKDIYAKLTGMRDDFHLALKSIESINKLRYGMHGIGIVINSLNYKHLKEHVQFCHENFPNITLYNLIYIDPVNRAKENKWTLIRLSESELYLYKALEYLKSKNLKIIIDRVPLCYLRGYEEYSANTREIIQSSGTFYFKINDNDYEYSSSRHNLNKTCDICSVKKICGGLPKNYIDEFGSSELYPSFDDVDELIRKVKVKFHE